ncbi:hypothetical protein F5X96DRAFT_669790 [Biscogniauxia mediterranea]|nr:hypothetical protein F5X96DRAFT_669790 [Biscogniauxia mediterranea]
MNYPYRTRKSEPEARGFNGEVNAMLASIWAQRNRDRILDHSSTATITEPPRVPGKLPEERVEDDSWVRSTMVYQQFQSTLAKAALQDAQSAQCHSSNFTNILQNAGEEVPFSKCQNYFISDMFKDENFHIVLTNAFITKWVGVDATTTQVRLNIPGSILQIPFRNTEFVTLLASERFEGGIDVNPDFHVLWPSYRQCRDFLDTHKIRTGSLWDLFQSFRNLTALFRVSPDTPLHHAELPGAKLE